MGAPASEWGGRAAGRAQAWESAPSASLAMRLQTGGHAAGRGEADNTHSTGGERGPEGGGRTGMRGLLAEALQAWRGWRGGDGLEVPREAAGAKSGA